MKILIIGVTGMLGNAMLRALLNSNLNHHVVGTARS